MDENFNNHQRTHMEQIIQQLTDYMTRTNASQTKVAKSLGISPATLSYFLKGTYTGDIDSICDKVKDFLEIEAQRETIKQSEGIVATKCFNTIHKFCSLVLTHQICGMLTGDAGCGKTTALKAFAKSHPSVLLIEADHGYTAKALFDELCAELGLDDRGSLHQKLVRIVDKLNDSGRLIIIDEAEHLPYRALELIRRVHDKAGVGIALCGMPRLEKNVQGDKNHYAQLNSRISAPCRAKLLDNNDIKAYIDSRFANYEADCIERASQICRRNFRLLSHLVMWSKEIMRNNKCSTLDNEVLDTASQMLVVAR